ncbi:zinc finger MYM-type protein 1-like [Rosa chinensis]|uniref:zinc finger MYM-type protein 1-like n=1 Tax=Rosa chinensis TaxID=74649 RepID=UPI000D0875A0|nr:zinc finger MYM-type protein 1-like [Rosa chinensis]
MILSRKFCGHDESDYSNNQGNFRELLKWHFDKVDDIKNVVLKNAPRNHQLTSPDIQHDIVKAAATETLNVIISDIGDAVFSILVDESRDVSGKEQMAIAAIDQFFSENGLSISSLRGQGYDGASNMRGEFNGLKALILKENGSAFYVHCFAHQLQLAIVAVAKNHILISNLFMFVGNLVNVAGSSCKRRDSLERNKSPRLSKNLILVLF